MTAKKLDSAGPRLRRVSDKGEPDHAVDVVGSDLGQRLGWDERPQAKVSDDPDNRGYGRCYDTPQGLQPQRPDRSRGDDGPAIAVGREGASAPAITPTTLAKSGTASDAARDPLNALRDGVMPLLANRDPQLGDGTSSPSRPPNTCRSSTGAAANSWNDTSTTRRSGGVPEIKQADCARYRAHHTPRETREPQFAPRDVDFARAIAAVITGISYHAILPGHGPFVAD